MCIVYSQKAPIWHQTSSWKCTSVHCVYSKESVKNVATRPQGQRKTMIWQCCFGPVLGLLSPHFGPKIGPDVKFEFSITRGKIFQTGFEVGFLHEKSWVFGFKHHYLNQIFDCHPSGANWAWLTHSDWGGSNQLTFSLRTPVFDIFLVFFGLDALKY